MTPTRPLEGLLLDPLVEEGAAAFVVITDAVLLTDKDSLLRHQGPNQNSKPSAAAWAVLWFAARS
jgi:hypothetical protein